MDLAYKTREGTNNVQSCINHSHHMPCMFKLEELNTSHQNYILYHKFILILALINKKINHQDK
jgi:hypothetical protein